MRNDLVGRPMEVLLVEDNRMDAHFAIRALEKANFKHRCTLVVNGEEAINYLQRQGILASAAAGFNFARFRLAEKRWAGSASRNLRRRAVARDSGGGADRLDG